MLERHPNLGLGNRDLRAWESSQLIVSKFVYYSTENAFYLQFTWILCDIRLIILFFGLSALALEAFQSKIGSTYSIL